MCVLQNGDSIADLTVIASPQESTAKGDLYHYCMFESFVAL